MPLVAKYFLRLYTDDYQAYDVQDNYAEVSPYTLASFPASVTPANAKYSPDGNLLAICFSSAPYFQLYDTTQEPKTLIATGFDGAADGTVAEFNPANNSVVVLSNALFDNYIFVLDSQNSYAKVLLPGFDGEYPNDAGFSRDGSVLGVVSGGGDGLYLYDVTQDPYVPISIPTLAGTPAAIAFHPSSDLCILNHSSNLHIYDTSTIPWTLIRNNIPFTHDFRSLRFSENGNLFFYMDNQMKVLDTSDVDPLNWQVKTLPISVEAQSVYGSAAWGGSILSVDDPAPGGGPHIYHFDCSDPDNITLIGDTEELSTAITYGNADVPADTTPDAFTFDDVTNASLSTEYSDSITVAGIDAAAAISITAGEYAINGGARTSLPDTVNNGDAVTVYLTSSSEYETSVSATLTIGGVSDTFTVTTVEEDVLIIDDILLVEVEENPLTVEIASAQFYFNAGFNPLVLARGNAVTVDVAEAKFSFNSADAYLIEGSGTNIDSEISNTVFSFNKSESYLIKAQATELKTDFSTPQLTIDRVARFFDIDPRLITFS